ncbi:hypothetical protein OIE75_29905 [Streptomyces sp. NBC_01723]|uniref:hypothetical protein n=1 Tax=Streptomyces sp. NBC_01723 TaxID=2975921 RepID=UPI002E2EBAC7|nr:hypothetical protein [Streptomyces sp. NBC_01723]
MTSPDRPAPAVRRDLAAALKQQATRAGESTPSVRGADWRTATVTLVNTDGTITADGIPRIRCLAPYTGPAVGDFIVISQSSSGNWVALNRLAATTRSWTTLPLSSGWAVLSGYYTPAYRIWDDGTASLCGLAAMSGSLPSGTVVATLPAEARPAFQCRFPVQVVLGFYGVMTLYPDGRVTLGDFSGTLSSTGQKWAEFDVASHYRLT